MNAGDAGANRVWFASMTFTSVGSASERWPGRWASRSTIDIGDNYALRSVGKCDVMYKKCRKHG